MAVFISLLFTVRKSVRSHAALQIEVLTLRHQRVYWSTRVPIGFASHGRNASVGLLRACLDRLDEVHVIVKSDTAYVDYYLKSRTHLSLVKDTPVPRRVASRDHGDIAAIPHVGGLHHRYERRAA